MSQFERPNPTINFPNGIQHKEHPVTDHMKAAIEAAAEALAQHQLDGDFNCECGHEHPNGSGDNFPAWRKALLTHEAKVTLHAAEPHLRAMIAKEIETAQFKVESIHHFHGTECLCGFNSYGRARSATEHITQTLNAAQIAKGPQL